MVKFTPEEYTDMILLYGYAKGNTGLARRMYAEKYTKRKPPTVRTIFHCVQRLRETGSVIPRREGVGCTTSNRSLKAEGDILEMLTNNPTISVRELAKQSSISRKRVYNILKENLSELNEEYLEEAYKSPEKIDFAHRSIFCSWMQQKIRCEPNLISRTLFTGECCFSLNGILNSSVPHYLNDLDKEVLKDGDFNWRKSINVWAGIIGKVLIGPVMLPYPLSDDDYLEVVQNTLYNVLDEFPLEIRSKMWYMHDGDASYFSSDVRKFISQKFPQRWISRYSSIQWPENSWDLHPLHFFLWSYMASLVYSKPIVNIEMLELRLFEAAENIRNHPEHMQHVSESFQHRVDACILANGGNFEHFL